MSKRGCGNTEKLLLAAACGAVLACAPARSGGPGSPLPAPPLVSSPVAFSGTGRARFVSPDGGEISGRLRVRVAPPARVWAEVRSEAVFGLVGDRFVACLPGDGGLLVQEDRADRLERVEFAASWAAGLVPGGSVAALVDWATGRVGGPAAAVAGTEVRVLQRDRDGRPRRCEWWTGGERRLAVEYSHWQAVGTAWVPSRLRAQAPGGFRTDIQLDQIAAQDSFSAADFQIDGNPEGR